MLRNLEQARAAVRAAAPLEEVLERAGVRVLGSGRERKALCPFHPDTEPSLGINIEKQVYFCHGCLAAGDVFSFVQHMDGISHVQAVRQLAESFGVDLAPYEEEPTPEERQWARLLELNRQQQAVCLAATSASSFRKWQERRRFDPGVLANYGVGWSARPPEILDADLALARSLQFDNPIKWTRRIVVPLQDESGRTVAFRTRSLDGSAPKTHGPEERHPLPVPPIYGFHQARRAIRDEGVAILVEGEPDVWQMAAHGYHNVVAYMGSSLTAEQAAWLVERGVRRVILLPDGDRAGREAALRLAGQGVRGLSVKVALLPEGDPDEVLLADPEQVATTLREARHLLEFMVDAVIRQTGSESTTQRMDALFEIAELLGKTPELEREEVFRYAAARLGFSVEAVADYFRTSHAPDGKMYDAHAEQVVLGRALVDEEFLAKLLLEIRSDDLFLHRHRRIMEVTGELFRSGQAVRADTVGVILRNRGYGSDALYVEQIAGLPSEAGEFLLGDLHDKALRRQVLEIVQRMGALILDTSRSSRELLERHASDMSRLIVGSGDRLRGVDVIVKEQMGVMHQRLADPRQIIGLDFGPNWFVLNHVLHGLQEGRYLILAAPSGVGKTAICCEWARQFAVQENHPTLYATFETGDRALALRMESAMSGVEYDKIVTGFMTAGEVELVHEAGETLAAAPLVITSRGADLQELLAIIRTDILRRGTKVVFVDYLQLMRSKDAGNVRRDIELGDISRALFGLCEETGVRIVAAAQINREGAKKVRSEGTDVGEAFKIYQDCDGFYIVNEKLSDEIERDGLQQGNRFGFLAKHRHGRDKIGTGLLADLSRLQIREVNNA